jgi:hypothetical protein
VLLIFFFNTKKDIQIIYMKREEIAYKTWNEALMLSNAGMTLYVALISLFRVLQNSILQRILFWKLFITL